MKIYDYKTVLGEDGTADLLIKETIHSDYEPLVNIGDVSNLSGDQLQERVQSFFKAYDLQLSQEVVEPLGYSKEQKSDVNDLKFVRSNMRKILQALSNPDTSIQEKKEMLAIYQTMCASASIITNACKLELAFQNVASTKKLLK